MIFALNAVRVITVAPVLVCMILVMIAHIKTYHQILKCEYASKETVCEIASTLSFIYANQRKRSQNPIRNFATFITFSDLEKIIVASHHIPIIGSAKLSISTLNPKKATNRGVRVVQIFAPITTHKAFDKPITQAHTNPSVIIVTMVLL
jgi:hypothetical protein